MKILLSLVLLISACSPSSCVTVNRINQIENTYVEKGGDFVDSLKAYKSVAGLSVDLKDNNQIAMMASGFAVSENLMMTAKHFCLEIVKNDKLKKSINITAVRGNKLVERKEVLVIKTMDDNIDMCILEGKHNLVPLQLQRHYFKNIHIGDKVFTVGNPLGIFPSKSVGYVILPKSNIEDSMIKNMMLVNISIAPGFSGSPLISRNGHVVGMIVAGAFPSDVSIAVRSDYMIRLLNSVK